MSDLERVVRPFQTTVGPVRVINNSPPADPTTTTYGTTRSAGQEQNANNPSANRNVLTGSFSLSATAYNKKYPREKRPTDSGGSSNRGPRTDEPDPFTPQHFW